MVIRTQPTHELHSRRSAATTTAAAVAAARSQASSRGVPEQRRQIELADLDDLRDPIKIGVRPTSDLNHIAAFLRQRYVNEEEEEPIPAEAQIAFYWLDKCLLGDAIPSGISRLYYRVARCASFDVDVDDGEGDAAVHIIWSTKVCLEKDQLQKAHTAIAEGATVGTLRRMFASLLEIEDANRIVVSARGGLRPGLLQGNNWEVAKIRTWLCQKIWIDVAPPRNYMVLRGVNEEYIYHPPLAPDKTSVDFRTLRNWMISRIITNVHRRASSRMKVEVDDVVLVCKGKLLNRHWRIACGQVVDFELHRAVSDKFIAEEAWLLPKSASCIVCGDDKRVSEMPARITESCEHTPNTCRDCISQWISSSMDTFAWDRLKCPECPQLLRFEDVRTFASPETFVRYDTLAMKTAVTSIHNFKWCLNPRCGSGQIVRSGCEKLRCHSCNAASCAQHNLPWHKGETCEEFDRRTRKQRRAERASEKKVKETTKACPQCHKDVHKFSGCDHITCVCGHEWCYICLETYYRDRDSFLQCKHKKSCEYFENPPNYEGGRAFMPFLNQMNQARHHQQQWGLHHRPHQRPPPADEWHPQPMPQNQNPFQPRDPPVADEAQQFPPPAEDMAEPFQFMMENFLGRGNHVQFHVGRERRGGLENDFLGAAAMFTMEQLMQRAR